MTKLLIESDYEDLFTDTQKQKIKDINEIQMNLLGVIDSQSNSIERIEENINSIDNNFDKSIESLEDANKNNFFTAPIVIGSIVGSVMFSPLIGLLGLKTGAVLSLSGGIIGGISGYKIQQ